MIDIPPNKPKESVPEPKNVDEIIQQVLNGLSSGDNFIVHCCSERHLHDAIEAGKLFSDKGYYCYHRSYVDDYAVIRREVKISRHIIAWGFGPRRWISIVPDTTMDCWYIST